MFLNSTVIIFPFSYDCASSIIRLYIFYTYKTRLLHNGFGLVEALNNETGRKGQLLFKYVTFRYGISMQCSVYRFS